MLDSAQLLPFLAAALALNLTPGADMTYVIARSATQGRAAGIAASLGIAAGSLIHSVLAQSAFQLCCSIRRPRSWS